MAAATSTMGSPVGWPPTRCSGRHTFHLIPWWMSVSSTITDLCLLQYQQLFLKAAGLLPGAQMGVAPARSQGGHLLGHRLHPWWAKLAQTTAESNQN